MSAATDVINMGSIAVRVNSSGQTEMYDVTSGKTVEQYQSGSTQVIGDVSLAVTAQHTAPSQSTAVLLTSPYNVISVCASQGDAVKLPVAVAGLQITLDNQGAQAAQVFGSGIDTINGIATATGISHAVGQKVVYYCNKSSSTGVAGTWTVTFVRAQNTTPIPISAVGANVVNPHVAADYVITAAGINTSTLAAPTTVVDDGIIITFINSTANAHTLICPATVMKNGGAAITTFTYTGTTSGGSLTLQAFGAKWIVVCSSGGAFS